MCQSHLTLPSLKEQGSQCTMGWLLCRRGQSFGIEISEIRVYFELIICVDDIQQRSNLGWLLDVYFVVVWWNGAVVEMESK